MKDRLDAFVRGPAAKYLQDPIVTIRDGRFVVPVKIEYRAQVPGIVHDQSAPARRSSSSRWRSWR